MAAQKDDTKVKELLITYQAVRAEAVKLHSQEMKLREEILKLCNHSWEINRRWFGSRSEVLSKTCHKCGMTKACEYYET